MRRSSRMLLLIRGHSIVFVVVRPQVLYRRFPSLKVLLVGRRTEVFPLPASDRGYIGAARCVDRSVGAIIVSSLTQGRIFTLVKT
jgi:hypothetical protein